MNRIEDWRDLKLKMSKTTLAILLNLFICPGAGHFALGKKKAGIFFGLAVGGILTSMLVGFCIVVYSRITILSAYASEPAVAKSFQAMQQAWLAHVTYYKFGIFMIIVIWILSALDAWRIGKNL